MPSTINILEPFDRIQPPPFISRYSDWILFTLLLFFFWAVAGIALKKRFGDSRHLRVLVTVVALMLSIGTYFSIYQGWIHLSLEGLGFFGAVLVLIVVFFVIFGMMRGYGMRLSNALSIGFILFYISLWSVSPNILHTLADIFPLGNTILGFIFLISVIKIIATFMRHFPKSPLEAAKTLKGIDISTPEGAGIDRELDEDKKEKKILKKRTLRFTKLEIKSANDIQTCLEMIINKIKEKGNSLNQDDVAEIYQYLRRIAKNENILKRGMNVIKKHLKAFDQLHRKDISELEKRLEKSTGKKQRKTIEEEIAYQRKMLHAIDFIERYESKIVEFTTYFNKLVYGAMQKMKDHNPNGTLSYLDNAYKGLLEMKQIYKKERELEKYLLKINKKTISDLKKEKDLK